MDSDTTIDQLKARVIAFRDARDWKQFHNPKDLAVGLSIEANELLELFQWKTPDQARQLMSDPKKAEWVRDELADVLIYALASADEMGIDLSDALMAKIEKNEAKYPVEKSKGNSKKYTEL